VCLSKPAYGDRVFSLVRVPYSKLFVTCENHLGKGNRYIPAFVPGRSLRLNNSSFVRVRHAKGYLLREVEFFCRESRSANLIQLGYVSWRNRLSDPRVGR
jgi:hypothetical protein